MRGPLHRASATDLTRISAEPYGQLADGTTVERYTLQCESISVSVVTYGARIESLKVPDRHGVIEDVVLGFDSLHGYVNGKEYTGAVVGRFANRIAGGRFALDGKVHHLSINAPPNSMHGGIRGFDRQVWSAATEAKSLVLTHQSPSEDEGFPGVLSTTVRYTLDDKRLRIDYMARTTEATVINLTNHIYFNLTGDPRNQILGHEVALFAECFTPIDSTMIPTGEVRRVKGTPFDFTEAARIGARIDGAVEQLQLAGGYDHNWVLTNSTRALAPAATVYEPTSGWVLRVLTSQPGLQFYTGNNLTGLERGRGGVVHGYRCGLCLETQHFPDSPNHPQFPSTELYSAIQIHHGTSSAILAAGNGLCTIRSNAPVVMIPISMFTVAGI